MKQVLISYFLLFSWIHIQGQTILRGNIKGAENCHIRFTYLEDYISGKRAVLFDTLIDDMGDFHIKSSINRNLNGTLELPYYSNSLYLEAGKDFPLSFDSVTIHNIIRPFYQKNILQFQITGKDKYLQNELEKLNATYDKYIAIHFSRIFQQHQGRLIDSLDHKLHNTITNSSNIILNQWIAYKIADLKLKLSFTPKKKKDIFYHYINEQDILYQSEEYMSFVSSFFKDYLIKNKNIPTSDLYYCINYLKNNNSLQDSLGKDPILQNEKIRELATLINLKSLYYNKDFSKEAILKILEQLNRKSKFVEHQIIAHNLIFQLPQLESGTKAPRIVLPSIDFEQDSLRLDNIDSLFTIIIFFNSHNANCIKQMNILDSLYIRKKKKYNFIGISLDEKLQTVQELQTLKQFHFPIYWNGWDWKLIDKYHLSTFPIFLSIDPARKIIRYPEYGVDEIEFDE